MAKTTLKRVHGYLAEFDSASAVYHASEKLRDAGFQRSLEGPLGALNLTILKETLADQRKQLRVSTGANFR